MNYEAWNQHLNERFFNETRAGQRVYLNVSEELLNSIVGAAQGGIDDFIAAIKSGPAEVSGSLCEQALETKQRWNDRETIRPPYLAFLCFFALAAGRDSDRARHAYYPRLRALLGEEEINHGMPRKFDKMRELWCDLEAWSQNDHKGDLGIFKAQSTAPHLVNVGLPIAQIILSEDERRNLPKLFAAADFEPGAVVSPDSLVSLTAFDIGHWLRPRTREYLRGGDSEYRDALLDVLQSELREWDGSLPALATGGHESPSRAGLRIWLSRIDVAGGIVESRIVASLPDKIDAEDLLLSTSRLPHKQYQCEPRAGRFSECLKVATSDAPLSADCLPWQERTEFKCAVTSIKLVLPGSDVRIFVDALQSIGQNGFVEAKVMPLFEEFYLAANGNTGKLFDQWGQTSCDAWSEISIERGLPDGWRLFKAKAPRAWDEIGVRYPIFPRLTVPHLRLEGGIRINKVSRYFQFALPAIIADWHVPPECVTINGRKVEGEGMRFGIEPDHVQASNVIEATFEGYETVKEIFYVSSDGWRWRDGNACGATGKFGQPSNGLPVTIRGADVGFNSVPPFVAEPATALDDTVMLLGRRPGEFADLRDGGSLPEWTPVWAVSKRRREVEFSFCGISVDDAGPLREHAIGSIRSWINLLWHERRRIKTLRTSRLRKLLRDYQEVARAL